MTEKHDLEWHIVEYCSQTLASLKTAGLFGYRYSSRKTLTGEVEQAGRLMSEKGIEAQIIKCSEERALIYVCRRAHLIRDLGRPEAKSILGGLGYPVEAGIDKELAYLKKRLHGSRFPHEIGLFLGYPAEDVAGFIQNEGRNCLFCGFWKVYFDAAEKKKLFRQFEKCSELYRYLRGQGRSIFSLTMP